MALAAAPEIPGFRAPTPLAYGPSSVIYSAQSLTMGRWVAVIVYSASLNDEQSQRRFRRGYEVARRLGTHPHAVTVLEFGMTAGLGQSQPYVATEMYERGTLEGQLQGGQVSTVGEVLRMGIALAGALETAHRAGVIHGGVHPARVLLAEDREPALSDLGLVPLVDRTGLAALVGPMTYHAPPEVLEGEALSPATDVYSLASTLYTALTGRAPYAGASYDPEQSEDTTASLLLRILQHDVPAIDRRDVPPSLEKVLQVALSSEARHRPARPLAFAQALQACQTELGFAPTQPIVLDIAATLNVVGDRGVGAPPAPASPLPAPASPWPAPVDRVFVPYPAPMPERPSAPEPAAFDDPADLPRPAPMLVVAPPVEAEPVVDLTTTDRTWETDVEEFPPPVPRSTPDRDDTPRTRALPVIVLGLLVAVIFAAVTWSIVAGEGSEGERAQPDQARTSPDAGTGPVTVTRSGLTAVESSVGVQLDWDGRSQEPHVVVILSTAEPPRGLPAESGTALLIPTADLNPTAGYCFAVVPAPEPAPAAVELAAEIPDEALGPDACVRSGSIDTVLRR